MQLLFFFLPLVALAMFLNKPYHIDDVLFLRMSDLLPFWLIGDQTGTVEFLGRVYENLSPYESTHPPFIPYFLKWISLLSEPGRHTFWIYHLSYLVFPALVLVAARFFSQVRHFRPVWVWFLIFSPIFFVNATNLMADIPMLSFWVASLCAVLCYCETEGRSWVWLAMGGTLAALMTSYQSIALLPLISVSLLLNRRPIAEHVLIVGVPAVIFVAFLGAVYLQSGFFPGIASTIDYNITSEIQSGFGFLDFLHKGISALVFLGFGLIMPTPLLLFSVNRRRLLEHLIFASILSFTLFHLGKIHGFFTSYSTVEILVLRSLILIGCIWSFQVAAKCVDGFRLLLRNRRPAGNLLIPAFWFLGIITYNVLFLPYATARYVLPALPPALILLFSHPRYRPSPWREIPLLFCGIALSIFCASLDYRQASADYRIFQKVTEIVAADSSPSEPGLWFSDDSGLHRYLSQHGASYLPSTQREIPIGDYVLITRGMIHPEVRDRLDLVREFQIPSFWGFTLFDTENRAGFYRSLDGFLPIARAPFARKASLYRCSYFSAHRDQARIIRLSHPNYFSQRVFTFPNGQKSGVLFMHPDAKIAYPVSLSGDAILSGRAVTQPANWALEGDGVTFRIGTLTDDSEHELWRAYLDGKSKESDRSGRPFRLVIPGETSEIWFEVGPGPAGDYRFDGAGWENLRLEGGR